MEVHPLALPLARNFFSSLVDIHVCHFLMVRSSDVSAVDDEPHAGPLVAVLRLFYPVPRLVRHIVYGTASFLLSAMCTFFYQSLPSASQPLVSRWYVACNRLVLPARGSRLCKSSQIVVSLERYKYCWSLLCAQDVVVACCWKSSWINFPGWWCVCAMSTVPLDLNVHVLTSVLE